MTAVQICAAAEGTAQAAVSEVTPVSISTNEISGWPAGPEITSETGVLMDADSGTLLYSKGGDEIRYPASITKIMTLLLAVENCSLKEDVVFTETGTRDISWDSGNIGMQVGEVMSMRACLYALVIRSANEVAAQIAEHVGGSTDKFVEMMNSFAAELGCTGTHFTNPHGLQDENHYTTPYDIYLMLKEALNYPEFTDITQMSSYTVTYKHSDGSDASTTLTATDHYLTGEATTPKDVTILGGKTGTTDKAGNCLALLSQNAYGKPFISIVMGASSKDVLYQEMTSLLQNIN